MVTGGAGFLGSHLADRLVDEGAEVLAIDDLSSGRLENLAQARSTGNLHFHQLDIRADELPEAVTRFGPEVVFHLAAQASVARSMDAPAFDASVNVVGTVNVLAAAVEAGAERVVFSSTGGALYGDKVKVPTGERAAKHPESPYGIAKKVVDEYFRFFRASYGLDYISLAFANLYGPRQDSSGEGGVVAIFARTMLERHQPVIFGDGKQTRDFVYVEDAVDALMRGAERGGGRLLNIGTGVETSILDVYRLVAEATRYRGGPAMMAARPGDLRRSALDAAAAGRHLGWSPFTPLPTGIRLTVDWFRFH